MKKFIYLILSAFLMFSSQQSFAQVPTCDSLVPFFQVDLTGQVGGAWTSPSHSRNDFCCGATSICTSFEIILDTGAAMINFDIIAGAIPSGSMFYQIGCGPQIPVGEPICVVGAGPHYLTFCKPGNNENVYQVTSIAKPTFPADDSTRIGCSLPVNILGLENITINSIFPGTSGAYNSLFSCINCPNPSFTPGLGTPAFIDYEICGTPIASVCGYVATCDTVRLYTFSSLSGNVTPNPAEFCSGGSGVLLTASGIDGSGNYSYEWYNSSNILIGTGASFNAVSQGNYTVVINDDFNSSTCPALYTSVPVLVGSPPVVDAGNAQDICANDPAVFLNGSVTNATGGIWSGGAGTYNPNNSTLLASYTPTSAEISAGSVILTLTSTGAGGGCIDDFDTMIITFSDTIDVSFTIPTLSCNNSTGIITATASNGTAPYSFIWNTGATTNFITVGEGSYWVDVTDFFGCIYRENVTVNAPTALTLSMLSTDVTVNGGSDGTATATVGGGTAPYTYSWSSGGNGITETGLSYGVVNVTITDANGCSITGAVVVNEPQCSSFAASATSTNVNCFNGADGTALASAVGGTSPYSYSWNTIPAILTAPVSSLSAGVYTVTVTDGGTCIDLSTVEITEPTQLQNNMTHIDNPAIGGNIGQATANPIGGTPTYSYSWSPGGQTTQIISSLFAGIYYVDITDANSCLISDSVIISEPPCNNFNVGLTTTNVSCNGGSDGSATATIVHGTPPYNISWSDGQTGLTATGLIAGSYTVTITEASNCTTFETVTITEPSPLSIGLISTAVSCFGGSNGTIDLSVSGGTFPYTYSWTVGANIVGTSEDMVNLDIGTYSVKVTDANKCLSLGSIGITQPSALTTTLIKTNTTCAGDADGTVDITPLGGVLPYSYSWTGPTPFIASSEDLTGISIGLYELVLTDANSCQTNNSAYIGEPDAVEIFSITADCPSAGATTTQVTVDSISGGDELSYNISYNNGSTYNGLGNLSTSLNIGATYQVVAVDGNGCSTLVPYNLVINPSVIIDSVTFNPCIPVGSLQIPITVYPNGGIGAPFEISTDNGVSFGSSGTTVVNLGVGTSYQIVVRDTRGCLSLATTITIPNEITASASLSAQVNCLGESDGAIDLVVGGGTSPYSYAWSGPNSYTATTEDLLGLFEGAYSVIVTDINGCTSSESITMTTVVDATNPSITCPTNIVETNDVGDCGAIVNYATPMGVDDCPLGINTLLTVGLATGSFFPEGVNPVTYTVTDSVGNSASCTFNVTVTDIEIPSIICSSDININPDPNSCDATSVTLVTPITNDNCGVASVTNNAPGNFPTGNTIVTWTVTDIHGNINTCTQLVTVTDDEDPTVICPGPVTVTADSGLCAATGVALGIPSSNDNCTVSTVVNDAPVSFPVGLTTVTWTVTDLAGNTTTCAQLVTVTDDEDPTITCPNDVTVFNDLGACFTDSANVSLGNPTVGDNCGVATITNNIPPTFSVGTTTVTWVVTDIHGNTATCTQDVIVIDNEDPVLTSCAAPVSVTANPGVCQATGVTLGTPTVVDNCGIATVTNDAPPFYPVGTTIVTWTITDANGNIITCTQDVTVTDDENPTITCPVDISVTADVGVCFATSVNLSTPVVGDNCSVMSITNDAPVSFSVGITTVTWTVTDSAGNTATCPQNVTITDDESPTITCPADVTVFNDSGDCFTDSANVSLGIPIVVDNCGIDSITNNAPAIYPVGNTNVTWTIFDIHGNSTVCVQVVTVVDNEVPVITSCAPPVVIAADPNLCGAAGVSLGAPVVNDNCGIATVTDDAPAFFPVGLTSVTWTITDIHGNQTTCKQDVTVTDDEDPTITCPPTLIAVADTNKCYATNVILGTPIVADNCGVASITNDAPSIFPVDTTIVTWIVLDIHGNRDTCYQNVIIEDTEAPVLVGCPVDTSSCDSVIFYSIPTASDNCGILSIIQVSGYGPGATFPVGTTTEVWEITDVHGNISFCSFDVTIHPKPISSLIATNASCYGFDDGIINNNMLNGTAPFTYLWSSGDTTQHIDSLSIGQYTVIVTDVFGCIGEATIYITQPDSLIVSETHTNVSCNSIGDGAIDLSVVGGTIPYTYNWSNGSNSQDLVAISGGTYSSTITDLNGCFTQISIIVEEPDSLLATGTVVDAICLGANGGIDVTVTGGSVSYQYLWSNGDTLQDVDSVVAGVYSVLITDANGCSITYQNTVGSYSVMTINGILINPLCFGDSNGSVELVVVDGTAPYSFNWSIGDTTQTIENILAGVYTVTVTDANGCGELVGYTLIDPDSLSLELVSSVYPLGYGVSGYGAKDGEIDMTIYGGTQPMDIIWSPFSNDEDLYNLPAGFYVVNVTDANGCTVIDSIRLTQPLVLELPTGYTPNGDGFNDNFLIRGIEVFPDNELIIYNRWGNIVYSKVSYMNEWEGVNNLGDKLPDGTYFVILKINSPEEITLSGYIDLRRTR